jgi:cytochrome P450
MEPGIELLVIAAAAVRAATVLAMPAARRELRLHPVLVAAAVVGALGGLVLLGWSALHSLPLLRAVTACVAGAWVLAAWRAHPAYGRRRGLPPGSLGLVPSLRAIVEPDFYAREARRHGVVFKMAQFHRPVACVVGLERCRSVLRQHGPALVPPPLPLSSAIPRGFLRYMAPADHERYAPLFRAAFSDAALAGVAPAVARETDRALATLAAAGPTGAYPQAVLREHLLVVLLEMFFGGLLHAEDRPTVALLVADTDYANAVGHPSAEARSALRRFEELIAARHAVYDARGDSSVWGSILQFDPAAATDPTVVGNLFLMLQASWDSIGGLVCWLVHFLGTAPDWVAATRIATPAPGDDPFARAVIEALRLRQSEYVYREVQRPITIDGFTVPRGWFVRLLVRESHRLDPPFERPEVYDPDRHLGRHFSAADLAPFGLDHHTCLGTRLTLAVARAFAERLVCGWVWTVLDDGPPERGNRHWIHWRPSGRLRVAIAPRDTPA